MVSIEKCVEELVEKANKSTDSNDALKFSQSAVNAANALCSLRTAKTLLTED